MAIHNLRFNQTASMPIRLDDFLARVLPGEIVKLVDSPEISKSKIRRLIIAGAVSINGSQARVPASSLQKGASIAVRFDPEKFSFEKQPDDIAFELTGDRILFEDDMIIVVNKPAGFPTEATMVASRDHLHAAVKRFLFLRDKTRNEPYVGLHHRLDRETSGVILFTKDRRANTAVHDMFLGHEARKEYEALTVRPPNLSGAIAGGTFFVDDMLGRISPKSAAGKWGAVKTGGDPAHTDFELLGDYRTFLRIQARPLTGRTHQIRVHLSGLGLPLLGDTLYGGPTELRDGNAKIPRIMLHAARLTFPHPTTGQVMTIEAPLPADFISLLGTRNKLN